MGCHRPIDLHCFYAGTDALAVDRAVLADLGVFDCRASPMLRLTAHWFGYSLPPLRWAIGGPSHIGEEIGGPHRSRLLRRLGEIGVPLYMYLSRDGQLFVPPFDPTAFPELTSASWSIRLVRRTVQRAFGIHPGS